MSRTRVAWFVFILSVICLVAPASQAQTSISLTFGSGTVGVYSDNGLYGFSGTDGLSLSFGNVAFNGTNYTDTNGALSFTAGGNTFSSLPVSGLTSQSSYNYYDSYPVWEEYCSFGCYWYIAYYEDEYYSGSSDTVNGTFAPGTPIEIGGQPFEIASGSFDFTYGYNYEGGCCGYYYGNYFDGGAINLTANPDPVVPEPSTYLTMGTGLLLLAGVFRRKLLKTNRLTSHGRSSPSAC